jgi:hypothetical protein
MACVYDPTLADDCTTPLNYAVSASGAPSLGNCAMGLPYDENGNPCPENAAATAFFSASAQPTTTIPTTANPIAASAGVSNGPSATPTTTSSILNFFSSIAPTVVKATTGTGVTTGLRQQINPATGQLSYYNPATGQYTGVVPSSSLLSGSSGLLLVGAAIVVGFLIFAGRKRKA